MGRSFSEALPPIIAFLTLPLQHQVFSFLSSYVHPAVEGEVDSGQSSVVASLHSPVASSSIVRTSHRQAATPSRIVVLSTVG